VYKPGKVAIVLQGRQAGHKVVVIKQLDEGTKERPYPHAIVAGIERYPLKVTKRMGAKKVAKRSKIKPFIKVVNYSHLFPTRYALELEGLKGVVGSETFKEVSQREDSKKQIKKLLEDRYTSGKNKWFFQPLRVRIPSPSHPFNSLSLRLFYALTSLSLLLPVSFTALSVTLSIGAWDADHHFFSSDLCGFCFVFVVLFAKPLHVYHMSMPDACPHHIHAPILICHG
ncbi:ribosomal L27e protein family-domain-containing protein, partial [Dichomitus squalens]